MQASATLARTLSWTPVFASQGLQLLLSLNSPLDYRTISLSMNKGHEQGPAKKKNTQNRGVPCPRARARMFGGTPTSTRPVSILCPRARKARMFWGDPASTWPIGTHHDDDIAAT